MKLECYIFILNNVHFELIECLHISDDVNDNLQVVKHSIEEEDSGRDSKVYSVNLVSFMTFYLGCRIFGESQGTNQRWLQNARTRICRIHFQEICSPTS